MPHIYLLSGKLLSRKAFFMASSSFIRDKKSFFLRSEKESSR